MPASLDTRPPGINNTFRPGNPAVATIEFPASSLDSRTFTATLGGITLATTNGSLVVVGDIMTVTASAALTTTLGIGSHDLLVTETTGGGSTRVLIGRWTGSNRPNATGVVTVQIVDGEGATVNVTGGPQAFSPNLILPTATVNAGAGTVSNGKILRAHSIRMPWNYTSDVDPVDVAMGTAIQMDGTITVTDTGGLGPVVQTGFYGPRGIINLESNWRWNVNMTPFGFAPVGYGDFTSIGNQATVAKDLAPSWSYLSARSVLADGATCKIVGTDVNQGGAAFVDSPVYATLDGGTLDGITNNHELTHFFAIAGFCGNTSVKRRIVFDAAPSYLGIHPTVPNPTGAHWSGFGNFDTTSSSTVQLDEEIGLRVQPFTIGATKVSAQFGNVVQVGYANITNTTTSPIVAMQIGVSPAGSRTFTLNDTGGGFSAGNNWIGIQVAPTIVYDSVGGALASFSVLSSSPLLKNVNGEVRTIPLTQMFGFRPQFRGDGAALTVTSHTGIDDVLAADIVSGGTVSITDAVAFKSTTAISTGATLVTRRGFLFSDGAGAGAITNQIGVDIPVLAKGGTLNIGIRNASTEVDTPSAQTLSAAGNAITATAKVKALTNSTGGSLTLTSAPTIADGQDGQIVELVNVGAQDIVIQDQGTLASSNLRLTATTITLTPRDTVRLRYNSTIGDWVQASSAVNVL